MEINLSRKWIKTIEKAEEQAEAFEKTLAEWYLFETWEFKPPEKLHSELHSSK